MRHATLLLLCAVVLAACPKRKQPERGIELVFRREGDVRPVVEKRLAQVGVVARITEDEGTLTLRVPDTGQPVDLAEVTRLLTLPARLEFCPAVDTPQLCDVDASDAGATVEREDERDRGCFLVGTDGQALTQAVDAGTDGRVLVGEDSRLFDGERPARRLRTYLVGSGCLTPRVMEAEAKPDPNSGALVINMTFDGPGATKFGDLTRKLVRKPLLIVFDGRVTSAPIVMEPITGGRAMLTFGHGVGAAEVQRIARALAGGPLPGSLVLERQGTYGPPSLMP